MKKIILISAIILVSLVAIFFIYQKLSQEMPTENWIESYTQLREEANIPDKYVELTDDFDYNNEEVKSIIQMFEIREYDSIERLVEDIGDYTFRNIEYYPNLTYSECISSPASEVQSQGKGVCSSMSKLDIAVLRGMGIASRPLTGCVNKLESENCVPFSKKTTLQSILFKLRERKTQNIKIEDGIVASKGGLHTWVEVWIPEKGWTILESTTGYLIDSKCEEYSKLNEEASSSQICGINYLTNKQFIEECNGKEI